MKKLSSNLAKMLAVAMAVMLFVVIIAPLSACRDIRADKTQAGDFITFPHENNEYRYSINQPDLAQLKQQFDFNTDDKEIKTELYADIFRRLGFSERAISNLDTEVMSEIVEEAIDITVSMQYIRSHPNGNQEVLSRDECLSATANLNSVMEIITIVTSTTGFLGGDGWYNLYGMFTWLSTPPNRRTDTISLAVSNFAWSASLTDFQSYVKYDWVKYGGFIYGAFIPATYGSEKVVKPWAEKMLGPTGLYYSWNLPTDSYNPLTTLTVKHSNFFFYIKGKAQMQNPNQASFNLFTGYTHLTGATTKEFHSYCYKSIP
ncbi:MAG: hypothetical protein FWF18_02590 [Dehalococcoidia bacterium]|nr:hypothetical protein [Dehalococcoidia bacterium]